MRILVVEDEKYLNKLIVKRLSSAHYSVDSCLDGEEALSFIEFTEYDAIVLDIMLPFIDGISILKKMRKEGNNTPVILLTAMDAVEDRVKGLNAGADDYLVKPFSFDELIARITAITRRQTENKSNIYTVEDLEVDCTLKRVKRAGEEIDLSSKEYSILEFLIQNEGIVVSREQIEQRVWSYDYEGASNMIDVYIRYLRKKMDTGYEKKLIHTKRNMGYVLKVEK